MNHESKEDYKLFKEIILDADIMKTSTLFNGDIGRDEEKIRKYFLQMVESNSLYGVGLRKILDKNNVFMVLLGIGL